ncbi:MAG: hypothetical protein GY696_33205 [Gammaproteobacteria bacterium]|nr:hypothetical protein [Gammaproteobacteria bacterium]
MIEKGENASIPARDMKTKNSIKAIGDVQDAMNLVHSGSVPEQVDEELISVLEDNIALLETEDKQREANKNLEKLKGLWTTIKEKDTTNVCLPPILTSCQKRLNKLVDEWATVKKYVPKSLDVQFDSCLWKFQDWLEERTPIATAAAATSERDSSIAGSASHQFEQQPDRKPRFEMCNLPS